MTLTVPLLALNQIDGAKCDWLVPGSAREKITRLAKSLPQKLRHQLGPLPEFVDAFLAARTGPPTRRSPRPSRGMRAAS